MHPDFGSGRYEGRPIGIPFDVVSRRTQRSRVRFEYADESNRVRYPIPRGVHIEGGAGADGDRHALLVDRDACKLYELFALKRVRRALDRRLGRDVVAAHEQAAPARLDLRRRRRPADPARARALRRGAARAHRPRAALHGLPVAQRVRLPRAPLRLLAQRPRAARAWASACGCARDFDVARLPRQARIVARALQELRDARRRQRLGLVPQRRAEPRLEQRRAAPARRPQAARTSRWSEPGSVASMRWKPGAGGNVEDRRSAPGGRAALPVGGGLVGVIVTVLILVLGGGGGYDVDSPFEQFPAQTQPAERRDKMDTAPDAESELVDFVSFVVGDLQKFWAADFQKAGREFAPTQLVLFRQRRDTGCGPGSAATGPFYCPRRPPDLRRPRLLPRARQPLPGAGRLRAGLRARARVRPPHPDAHRRSPSRSTSASREDPDQRNALSVRTRAAGRLPRRRVGALDLRARAARGGRPRGGADRRLIGRRRPHPGSRPRAGSARRPSRTAPPSSAPAGSSAASRTATRPPATRSPATSERTRNESVKDSEPGLCRASLMTEDGSRDREGLRTEPSRGGRMPPQRLSALDASFLAVEGPAHTCTSAGRRRSRRPRTARAPTSRPCSTTSPAGSAARPRFRQRIAPDALGLNAPLWIDAEDFDPAEHIHRSAAEDLPQLADAVLSEPLRRDRPLWEFWIADRLRRRAHRARRQGPPLHGRRPRGGRARHAAARRRAAGGAAGRPPTGSPPPPRTRSSCVARGAWDRTRDAARAAARPARARPLAARDPRLRAAHRPRARRRGAADRARRARSTSPARRSATSPPRGGRSTSCARSRTRTA